MSPTDAAARQSEFKEMLRHYRQGVALDTLLREDGLTGRGVRVVLLDTGIHTEVLRDHAAARRQTPPNLRSLIWKQHGVAALPANELPSSPHGTVVADILLTHAPEIELISVDVFGPRGAAEAETLADALNWATRKSGGRLANISLGVAETELVPILRRFHLERAVLEAYLQGLFIVAAAHNDYPATRSFPAHFSSSLFPLVQSPRLGPQRLIFQEGDPIEFASHGLGSMGAYLEVRANSWAAPQATALAAKLLELAPDLRPFELKTLLYWAAQASPGP